MTCTDDEKTYLKNYDSRVFKTPIVTVDTALFTFHDEQLKVLLVQRSNHPDKGMWGLPGGFVDLNLDEALEDSAIRNVREKTKVDPPYIEQLYTFGGSKRDKRGWSVTICYTALIAHQECEAGISSISGAKWVAISELKVLELAFDHLKIISSARERLKQKALYSIVPAYALPVEFTLPELQLLHEVLLEKPIQKKSFRRRIDQADLLVDTGNKRAQGGGRPATLYRMKEESGSFTFVRNLEM